MPDQPAESGPSQSRAQQSFDEFDDLTAQAERLGVQTPSQGWNLDQLRSAVRAARQSSAPVEQATAAPGERRTLGDSGQAADTARGGEGG